MISPCLQDKAEEIAARLSQSGSIEMDCSAGGHRLKPVYFQQQADRMVINGIRRVLTEAGIADVSTIRVTITMGPGKGSVEVSLCTSRLLS